MQKVSIKRILPTGDTHATSDEKCPANAYLSTPPPRQARCGRKEKPMKCKQLN